VSEALLAQLADDPTNTSLLAVLGDALEREGDPRGELIAMQLGLVEANVEDAVAIARRREELRARLTPEIPAPLEPWLRSRFQWGIGYIRSFDLGILHGTPSLLDVYLDRRDALAAALGELWSHPSLRLLHEVIAVHGGANLLLALAPPPMVRSLVTARGAVDVPDGVATDLEALGVVLWKLPRLARLQITSDIELDRVEHHFVETLVLERWTGFFSLRLLDRKALPALRSLAIAGASEEFDHGETCDDLARTGLLEQIDRLAIRGPVAPAMRSVRALERGLAGRKLAELDVGGPVLERDVFDALGRLCEQLVGKPADQVLTWVEHANKPEWGRGAIVRIADGKVEVDFPGGGRKVFKADAEFLRFG
jgi:hypothetical protein